jgi:hypothetical protein
MFGLTHNTMLIIFILFVTVAYVQTDIVYKPIIKTSYAKQNRLAIFHLYSCSFGIIVLLGAKNAIKCFFQDIELVCIKLVGQCYCQSIILFFNSCIVFKQKVREDKLACSR